MSANGQYRSCEGGPFSLSDKRGSARQNDPELSECARLGVDLNRPAMLLDDDVVTDGQAKPRSFSGWLGRKEGSEQPFLHLGQNAGTIVADPDLDPIPEVLVRILESPYRAVATSISVRFHTIPGEFS